MSDASKYRRRVLCLLSFAALAAAALLPTAAAADPSLAVELTHTPASIPRNNEQLAYVAKVRNVATASPAVGDTLTCNGVPAEWGGNKEWNGKPIAKLTFSYQWLRGGVPIPGQSGPIPKGGPLPTYTIVAEDAGEAIQCAIKETIEATNPAESPSSVSVTQPAAVIDPTPTPQAPLATVKNSRATIEVIGGGTASVGKELRCIQPADWSGGATWTFRWLRNGTEAGAGETYTVSVADDHAVVQCEAIASNGAGEAPAGGTAIAVSGNVNSSVVGTLPAGVESSPQVKGQVANAPQIEFQASTTGEVRLEVELPAGGPETRVYEINVPIAAGWSCAASEPEGTSPALVTCSRTTPLGPQEEFPQVELLASLGAGTPDPAIAVARVSGGGSASHETQDQMVFGTATPFGITAFSTKVRDPLGADYKQAGGHPYSASGTFELARRTNGEGSATQIEFLKDIVTDLPAGFIGNPRAVPQLCSGTEAVRQDLYESPACPRVSIVGYADLVLGILKTGSLSTGWPIYAITPERGAPAQFVIYLRGQVTLISVTPRLRPSEGYAIRLESPALSKNPTIFSVGLTLCSYGVNVEKGGAEHTGAPQVTGCKPPTQGGIEPANPQPFLTNPTQCSQVPPVTKIAVDSWERAGRLNPDGSPDYTDPNWHLVEAIAPKVTGCDVVPFDPTINFQPTSAQADSPTGLDVSISMPTSGLESPTGIAQSALKKAVVTLPKGMAVNPSSANGLGACNSAQISLGTNDPVQCPDSSKIGSAEIETPLLEQPLTGSVYLAQQGDNPFHSLLALYLVAESEERGILVKIPGHVEPQPDGQLVANFDDNPQVPFSSLKLHFNSGNRAPLLNPPSCGIYEIESALYPWSAPGQAQTVTSSFQITEGPNGGPCPSGGLAPKLNAGVTNPVAGSTSPFVMNLSREDGTGRFSGIELTPPPGLTAYLKGIPYCPDATLAGIPGAEGTGAAQLASPSCPAASQVGSVSVGAGGGSSPYYVNTGRVYLAGPYKGAPLSLAIVTPAVAGPFDLGNVVVRAGTYVNPETAQITVKSDPIPTILHGIPLDVRDIRVNVDRPNFTVAPTNCKAMSVDANVTGPAGSASTSDRFQVGECRALNFAPKLSLKLKGGTKRNMYPALTATLTQSQGQANIRRVQVLLPHSEFLEQGHIGTICTRVQFNAVPRDCPAKSVYGYAEAESPLLGYALKGPVYLRANGGERELPDLVAALRGPASQPVEVDLVGYVDSVNARIRNTFALAPDAPVSKFVLRMKGGKKGLLVNSRNICNGANRATAKFDGQNGKIHDFQPALKAECGS